MTTWGVQLFSTLLLSGGWTAIMYADNPDTSHPANNGIYIWNIEQPGFLWGEEALEWLL